MSLGMGSRLRLKTLKASYIGMDRDLEGMGTHNFTTALNPKPIGFRV